MAHEDVHDGHSISLSRKFRNLFAFINCLRVELFYFALLMIFSLNSIPTSQLFQDKICRQKLNQSAEFCAKLSEMDDQDDPNQYKIQVLTESSGFNMYLFMISLCPSIFWSLIIGSWVDKYYYAKKFLLLFCIFTLVLDSLILSLQSYWFDMNYQYILLAFIPEGITGAILSAVISVNAYTTAVTPARLLALRMAIIQVTTSIAAPVANVLVGILIDQPAIFGNGQLHNYSIIFLISAGSGTLAFFWILFMFEERKDKKRFVEYENMIDLQNNKVKEESSNTMEEKNYVTNVNPIKLLFNFSNLKDVFVTCFKRRKNKVRLQLWLCLISMSIFVVSHYGPIVFSFQFNQIVYNWGPKKQSYIQTISSLVTPIMLSLSTLILVKILKLRDMPLAMFGVVCYAIQGIILGTFLSEMGNYTSIIFGTVGGLTSVGINSHLSKVIPPEEMGKVFSLTGAILALAPLISSIFFTNIFRLTVDSMPGLGYLISSALIMIALYSFVWIDLNSRSREREQQLKKVINET